MLLVTGVCVVSHWSLYRQLLGSVLSVKKSVSIDGAYKYRKISGGCIS